MKFQEFSSLFDLMKAFPTDQACIAYFEKVRWNGKVISPFDKESTVYKCPNNRYKCRNTNKYFNVRTNSIFQDSKIPLTKWVMAIYIFTSHKKGISSYQLAKDISITQANAWFMIHRLRFAMGTIGFWKEKLSGTVEADETFLGGNPKNRHGYQSDDMGKAVKEKLTVVGVVQRKGEAVLKHTPDRTAASIQPVVTGNVMPGSNLITDELGAYESLKNLFDHETIKHMAKEYVRGNIHTNTIENLWSQLKWVITGSYKSTSAFHLQSYLNEFVFRYNRRKQSEYGRMNSFLNHSFTGTLKYRDLIKRNKETV